MEQEAGLGVDEYVAGKLGTTVEELHRILDGVQIDALALAFNAFDRGEGFILGDMTGVGKGRVGACIMLYSKRNRQLYVFATENNGLYSDIGRDLHNVGYGDFAVVPTNRDLRGNQTIVTPQGKKIKSILPPPRRGQKKIKHAEWFRAALAEGVARYDENGAVLLQTAEGLVPVEGIFTTYSQLQGSLIHDDRPLPPGQEREVLPPRALALLELAEKLPVTMVADESHDAAGESSSRIRNLTMILSRVAHVIYMSATWAKRPDNIPLYSKTSLRYVYHNQAELVDAFRSGRVALQQVITWMLARDGVFLSRQMDFSQAQVDSLILPVEREQAEKVAEYLRRLYALDERFTRLVRAAAGANAIVRIGHGAGRLNVEHTGVFSLLHNLVGYTRTSLKLTALIPDIIEKVRSRRKVLVGLARTLESTMREVIDETGARIAEGAPPLASLMPEEDARQVGDLRLAFLRYLMRVRVITVQTHQHGRRGRESRRVYLQADMFTGDYAKSAQELMSDWEALRQELARPDNLLARIPLYPVDFLRSRLAEQGLECNELTGRKTYFEYQQGSLSGQLRPRPGAASSPAGRRKIIDRFNGRSNQTPLHVLVANSAAATGISLHASPETGTDWDWPRMGYIVEPLSDVNEFQQFLGRIYRKGQVHGPTYVFVSGDMPCETRPMGSLSNKLRSLNANVSANAKGLADVNIPDLFGEVADQVAFDLLLNNPELNRMLGNILKPDEPDKSRVDECAAKLTGRLAIAPLALQENIMQALISGIHSWMEGTSGLESNTGEAARFDLDITPYAYGMAHEATGEASIFQGPVFLLLASTRRIEPPVSCQQFLQKLETNVGLGRQYTGPDGWQDTMFHALLSQPGLVNYWLNSLLSRLYDVSRQIEYAGGDSKIASAVLTRQDLLVARSILGTAEAREHPVFQADILRAIEALQTLQRLTVRLRPSPRFGPMHQELETAEEATVAPLKWLHEHGPEDSREAGRIAENWLFLLNDTLAQFPPSIRSYALAKWRMDYAATLWAPRRQRLIERVTAAAQTLSERLRQSVTEQSSEHEQEAVRAAIANLNIRSRQIIRLLDEYAPGSGVTVFHQFENTRLPGIIVDVVAPPVSRPQELVEPGSWKFRIHTFSTAPSLEVAFSVVAAAGGTNDLAGLLDKLADATPNVFDEPGLRVGRETRLVLTGNIPLAYQIATQHMRLPGSLIAESTFVEGGPQYVVLLPRSARIQDIVKEVRLAPRDQEEMNALVNGGINNLVLDAGHVQFRNTSKPGQKPQYKLMVPLSAPLWWNNKDVLQIVKRHGYNRNGFAADPVDRTMMTATHLQPDQVLDLIQFGLRADDNSLHHSWWVPTTEKEQFSKILGRDPYGWTILDESKLSAAEREALGLAPSAPGSAPESRTPHEPPAAGGSTAAKGSPAAAPGRTAGPQPAAPPGGRVPTYEELKNLARQIANAGIFRARRLGRDEAGRYRLRHHDIQIIKRLRGIPEELVIVAHEVGHAIHAKYLGFQDLTLATGPAAVEFVSLGRSIYPNKKNWKLRDFADEGWAEIWSLWLMDSAKAEHDWPHATQTALAIMQKTAPDVMALLYRLRDGIATVRAHGNLGWVQLGVVDPTDPRRGTLSVNSVSLFRAFWPIVRAAFRRLHRAIDNRAPFKWFDEAVAKAYPEYFSETDDPVPGLRDFVDALGNSSANMAMSAILYHGPFSISKANWGKSFGPNLDTVFLAVRKYGLAMVDWYCACRHSLETWVKGKVGPIDFATASQAVDEMEQGRPELRDAHQALTEFNNGLCRAAQDCAVPGFEDVEQAISFWRTYVPLYRQREDTARPGANMAVPSLDPPPLLRRRHGSLRPILSPTIMTMVRAVWFYDRMLLAQRLQRMVEMADAPGRAALADYIESQEGHLPGIRHSTEMGLSQLVSGPLQPSAEQVKVPMLEAVEQLVQLGVVDQALLEALQTQDKLPPLEFWFTIWKRSNRHYIRVNQVLRHKPGQPPKVAKQVREIDPHLYAAMLLLHQTGAPQTDSLLWSGILRTMRFFTRLMRLGWIGLNHRFGLNNLLLDYQRFLWKSDQATPYTATLGYFKAVTDLVCGFIEEIAKGKSTSSLIKLFLDTFGITSSTFLAPESGTLPQRMKGLIKQQTKGPFGRLLNIVTHPVRTAEEIISSSDLPARLAAATEEAGRRRAGIEPDYPLGQERGPALAALLAARRATTDFAVGGTSIQTASANFWPLLNAYITTKYQSCLLYTSPSPRDS